MLPSHADDFTGEADDSPMQEKIENDIQIGIVFYELLLFGEIIQAMQMNPVTVDRLYFVLHAA